MTGSSVDPAGLLSQAMHRMILPCGLGRAPAARLALPAIAAVAFALALHQSAPAQQPCNPVIDGTYCATQMPRGRTSASSRPTPMIRPVSDFGSAFSTGGDTPGTFAGMSFRSSGSTCIGLLRRGSCS